MGDTYGKGVYNMLYFITKRKYKLNPGIFIIKGNQKALYSKLV